MCDISVHLGYPGQSRYCAAIAARRLFLRAFGVLVLALGILLAVLLIDNNQDTDTPSLSSPAPPPLPSERALPGPPAPTTRSPQPPQTTTTTIRPLSPADINALITPAECEEFLSAYTVWLDDLERVIRLAEDLEAVGYESTADEFMVWREFNSEHARSVPTAPLSGCGLNVIPEHHELAAAIKLAADRSSRLVERLQQVDTSFRRAALAASLDL